MIFLGCSAIANEIENCDRVQFSFEDLNGINTDQNFTKQSHEKNGQSVYYSFSRSMETIIWRNNANNAWLAQTRLYYEGIQNWKPNWKADKNVTNSLCLIDDSSCIGIDQDEILIDDKETRQSHLYDTKNPCKFPFKYFGITYNSCTRKSDDAFWCATSVDANLDWLTHGYCNEAHCPLEVCTLPV